MLHRGTASVVPCMNRNPNFQLDRCRNGVVSSPLDRIVFIKDRKSYHVHLLKLQPQSRCPGETSRPLEAHWGEIYLDPHEAGTTASYQEVGKSKFPAPNFYCFSLVRRTPADRVVFTRVVLLNIDRPSFGLLDDSRLACLTFNVSVSPTLSRCHDSCIPVLGAFSPYALEIDRLANL